MSAIAATLAAVVALAAFALRSGPSRGRADRAVGSAPRPLLVGLGAFALALPWFALVFLAYGGAPALPPAVPITGGVGLVTLAFVLIGRWQSSRGWADVHCLALILGALMASMLAGSWVLRASRAPAVDVFGKVVFNAVAIVLLVRLGRTLRGRRDAA